MGTIVPTDSRRDKYTISDVSRLFTLWFGTTTADDSRSGMPAGMLLCGPFDCGSQIRLLVALLIAIRRRS